MPEAGHSSGSASAHPAHADGGVCSPADFAKPVELFDTHGVSFVSMTRSFNTTTSTGRLTLNLLLSFAQFEREVIGDQDRDKITASKRNGIWVGGPVPLGYRSEKKRLALVAEKAAHVWRIFQLYLDNGAIGCPPARDRQERCWKAELISGAVSTDEIADREVMGERNIRKLLPLACLSPIVLRAIANGGTPADLTIRSPTSALPQD